MERTPSPRKVMSRSSGQQGGRTRTTGTGKLPKRFKRVAVSFQHKLSVIEFYDAVVTKEKMRDTVNYFYPSLTAAQLKAKKRQVYNWLNQRDLIIDKPGSNLLLLRQIVTATAPGSVAGTAARDTASAAPVLTRGGLEADCAAEAGRGEAPGLGAERDLPTAPQKLPAELTHVARLRARACGPRLAVSAALSRIFPIRPPPPPGHTFDPDLCTFAAQCPRAPRSSESAMQGHAMAETEVVCCQQC
ncbi:hypothetical protein PHYSODRAFT_337402 [Phytophthora sojae]|uniref:Uncharacterized protein n=1 Tax=Phytophthora sojae (strain P6497) TaxID=1094619 RepID=G5A0Y4_PHYSP|nr:hypothetical protein PHYSODRAFT_337402 [Phytophthora sojae]EGZ10616.1 hypothetical protein PHYSODRAFT_337402 [Phytophthora sojae]|eukprot:XP_009533361.1 hypothetical protein PHYSODRAFT_337402 [Phytophthora sojae]